MAQVFVKLQGIMNWLIANWLILIVVLWTLATFYLLIEAIRLCYRIEKRSYPEKFERAGVPQRANIPGVAFNYRVARDPETQAMRRQMNLYLIVILGGFIAFALLISQWARTHGA